MRLFGKSSKVTPTVSPTADSRTVQAPPPKRDNYTTDTFYMCTPGRADFFIEKLMMELTIKMVNEQQRIADNNAQMDLRTQKLAQIESDLERHPRRPSVINREVSELKKELVFLEIQKLYLDKEANAFIPFAELYTSREEAILASLAKETGHDLILTEIKAPIDKMHMDKVRGVEVCRPNLLSCVETVSSIKREDALQIVKARGASPLEPDSRRDKEIPAVAQAIDNALANSTIFQKTVNLNVDPSESKKSRSRDSLFTAPAKNKTIALKINDEITLYFAEIKPQQVKVEKHLEAQPYKPSISKR